MNESESNSKNLQPEDHKDVDESSLTEISQKKPWQTPLIVSLGSLADRTLPSTGGGSTPVGI